MGIGVEQGGLRGREFSDARSFRHEIDLGDARAEASLK
jgi:hypothetical protein